MRKPAFIPVLRELVRAYQEFEAYSARHVRALGLTTAQFDIVATLGNTPGMSFKELGEKTLITKGTLTGVVDRLEAKGFVRRVASPSDGRSQIVELTRRGETLFQRVFPAHVEYIGRAFSAYPKADLENTEAVLERLRGAFFAANQKSFDQPL